MSVPTIGKIPIDTRGVIVSQETSAKPRNNPTEAIIDNKKLLTVIQQHLISGGTITCELVNVILPSKFQMTANFLVIDVDRWPFKNVSLLNNDARNVIGWINTAKINNFATAHADDSYHPVNFGTTTQDPGKAVLVAITDMYDIKNFTINVRDAVTSNLLTFSAGKYPFFHFEFKFYSK